MKVFKELAKAVRRFAFEFTDDGHVYFPEAKLLRMGVFTPKLVAPDGTIIEEMPIAHNRTVMQGRNHQLDVIFHGGTAVGTWYRRVRGQLHPARHRHGVHVPRFVHGVHGV